MPNIGDLGESHRYAREVLGPRVTEPRVLHGLPRGERREFFSLATRLSFRLHALGELVDSPPTRRRTCRSARCWTRSNCWASACSAAIPRGVDPTAS